MAKQRLTEGQFLLHEFERSLKPLWLRTWRELLWKAIAVHAATLIDFQKGDLLPSWTDLDRANRRTRIKPNAKATWDECVALFMDSKPARAEILDAFRREAGRTPNAATLAGALYAAMPALLRRQETTAVFAENPFPQIWPDVANEIAKLIFTRNIPKTPDREWEYLNGLLIASLISASRLPGASHILQVIAPTRSKIMSVRGSYFRIPELVHRTGILDIAITHIPRTGGVILQHGPLTALIAATAEESRRIPSGQGVFHERLGVTGTSLVPQSAWGVVTEPQLVQGRSARFKLYEYSLLTYLALSSIEQLLRSWAHRQGVRHLKPSGQPEGVLDWIDGLSNDQSLRDAIDVLYNSDKQNIRNRVMHGNLLEIEGKDLEVSLPIAQPQLFRALAPGAPDPYSPENIAQHCLRCLEILDGEIATSGTLLVANDLNWNAALALTNDEITFGVNLSDDFAGPDAERWLRTVTDYLNAMLPGLKQLFTLGLVAWLEGHRQLSIPRFMAMGLTFEALYRLTVHLKGFSILQSEARKVDKSLKFQYRMLDPRVTSICRNEVTESLVSHIPTADRENAKRVLRLAVKVRNALAHGAVVDFSGRTAYSIGHVLVKAVQNLVTAGIEHMTAETAFLNWKSVRQEANGHDTADWFQAQKKILARIKAAAQN